MEHIQPVVKCGSPMTYGGLHNSCWQPDANARVENYRLVEGRDIDGTGGASYRGGRAASVHGPIDLDHRGRMAARDVAFHERRLIALGHWSYLELTRRAALLPPPRPTRNPAADQPAPCFSALPLPHRDGLTRR